MDCKNNNVALKSCNSSKIHLAGGYEFSVLQMAFALFVAIVCAEKLSPNSIVGRYKINDGWRIVAIDYAANYDSYIYCEHCNKTIVEDWQESEEVNN